MLQLCSPLDRGDLIGIHILVPADRAIGTVANLDAIRDESAEALGASRDSTRLTINFTTSAEWI